MPTRTGIPIHDCGLSFTNGQKLCADDIAAILDFGKVALQRGDTVVSEGPQYSEGNRIGASYFTDGARVGFRRGYTTDTLNGAAYVESVFYFENAGQESYSLILNALIGNRPPADIYYPGPYQGRVIATMYDHVGGTKELYNSQTDATPNNVQTLVTKSGAHGLTLPTPGQAEAWSLKVSYELRVNGFADPVNGTQARIEYPEDGARSFSLKLFSAC